MSKIFSPLVAAVLGFAVLLNVNNQLFAQSNCDKVEKLAEEIEKAKEKKEANDISNQKRLQREWEDNKLALLENNAAKNALEKILSDDEQATEKMSPDFKKKIEARLKVIKGRLAILEKARERLLIRAGAENQKLSQNCKAAGSSSFSSGSSSSSGAIA